MIATKAFIDRELRCNMIEALTLLKKINFQLSDLESFGFIPLRSWVYAHNQKKVVVKNMYFCGGFWAKPLKRVPTIIVRKDPDNRRMAYCVQPLISTDIRGYGFNSGDFDQFDDHTRNLGIFNGEVVMLDW